MPRFSPFVIALSSFVWSVVAFGSQGLPGSAAESAQSLDAKLASILPTGEENRWLTIPWRTNAMQARLEAQNLNRPLFLWIMNGNPLGCT